MPLILIQGYVGHLYLFQTWLNSNLTLQVIKGANAYAVLSSPRQAGAEAMVISASWRSRIDEGQGALNLRGVSTVLALANFVKSTFVRSVFVL